ncbi:MAG TPA: hypothetical protein VG184_05690, partial [Acidimicrobiales bacterium]|nr:hypothetical protein [Acidimicrobiales bacterium]
MIELRLREGGPPVVCELPDALAERLVGAGVITVNPLGPQRWEVRAARKVGVVRAGPVTVWVDPKITVARLLWLLGWAKRPGWLGTGLIGYAPAPELVPALAEAFASQAERTLGAGLLQGYREIDDATTVLRGRLREHDQVAERHGMAIPLLVRYDDYRSDIAENQLLRAAAGRLLRLPGVGPAVRARLRALRGLLIDISDLVPGTPLPQWRPTRLNARYHDALWLAGIVLTGGAVDHEPGALRLDGFLVDMYQVFEDFVTVTLADALGAIGGRCRAQDRSFLDTDDEIDIRPDLVWRVGERPVAVIDAKYKAEQPAGFPQADVYQALAYATAYRLGEAHLVYAHGNEGARAWTVRNAGVRIIAHTL